MNMHLYTLVRTYVCLSRFKGPSIVNTHACHANSKQGRADLAAEQLDMPKNSSF